MKIVALLGQELEISTSPMSISCATCTRRFAPCLDKLLNRLHRFSSRRFFALNLPVKRARSVKPDLLATIIYFS